MLPTNSHCKKTSSYSNLMVLIFLLIVLSFSISLNAAEILYPRYPALSPDGNTIAFTYQGDIWLVSSKGGEAHRLTIHEAEDIKPQFSPDGKNILFSSRRFNNYDAFIIPIVGGQPKQLTFHSAEDLGTGWFPDGDSVLIFSRREGRGDMYKVSVDGGALIKLTGDYNEREFDGKITPDGKYMIFTTGTGFVRWWRRDLRTGGNSDIYLQDRSSKEFKTIRITKQATHDLWPVVNSQSNNIYYVAAIGDWAQIYKKSLDGGEALQITNYTDDGVQFFNSNPQGTMLVFEQDFKIWILDPQTEQAKIVPIEIVSDLRNNKVEKKTLSSNVEYFMLSPDEKKIAAVIHGEIYVMAADDPQYVKQVTFTAARERYPSWGNDSQVLYYQSDRDGNYDIYSVDVVSLSENRLTNTPDNEAKPLVSPDGKYLIFYRGLDKIIRYDLTAKKETNWVEGNFYDLAVEATIEYGWSPDSKWITFSMAGVTYETDMYIANLDGKIENITKFSEWNLRPRFSSDGKKVYFTTTLDDRYHTWEVSLQKEPLEFSEATLDTLFLVIDDKETELDDVTVRVDFDNIEMRLKQAFNLSVENESPVLLPDGEKYLIVSAILGKSEIWSVDITDDNELKQLTHSGKVKTNLQATSDSKHAYFLESGKVKKLDISKSKTTTLDIKAVIEVDQYANNRQKFYETWSMLKHYFYDPQFHGADWDGVKTKYEPLLDHVTTDVGFDNMMMEVMGELRGSHLHIYSHEPATPTELRTGKLGFYFDPELIEKENTFKVSKIIKDSPADRVGIKSGQYILAIDGLELDHKSNYIPTLAGKIGKRVVLKVSDGKNGKSREVQIKPISTATLAGLIYEDWVMRNREIVDSLSNGRLAYLHIKRMYPDALQRFKRELVSLAEHKEGLIVDVRENGGGNIAVHLLGMLERTPYMLRNFRSFPAISENKMRSKAVEKPMILLINNYSGSNSEIFAEGFRTLKLGKIVGTPTGGGVIGTSSYTLLDGTRVRRPSWGAYTLQMESTDLIGRQPDIFVEELPDHYMNGKTPQLEKAVLELLKELK